MRIFLSYGHDQYLSLAERIKRDLEAQGDQVWFDVDRLKTGGDWERYIEDGLDWTSADLNAGRFLLLMTPHSVRRPNGYCLNEIARAHSRNLPIIPVMVSSIEPPLSICRLQWLDMRQCFPSDEHEAQYAKEFPRLVKALEEKQVPFEGVQQRLLNYLQPIDYSDDLSRHLPRFTGRQWVMKEVDRWLASSRRVLWITGEAGVGKSALAAWLCDERPEITAYHYCRFGTRLAVTNAGQQVTQAEKATALQKQIADTLQSRINGITVSVYAHDLSRDCFGTGGDWGRGFAQTVNATCGAKIRGTNTDNLRPGGACGQAAVAWAA